MSNFECLSSEWKDLHEAALIQGRSGPIPVPSANILRMD
jgi:hypothetical protein